MSELALRKLAEKENVGYLTKKKAGNRLLLHLFKPTTPPEIVDLFRDDFMSVENDKRLGPLYMNKLIFHAQENID